MTSIVTDSELTVVGMPLYRHWEVKIRMEYLDTWLQKNWSFIILLVNFFFRLGMEPRTLHMLGKCSTIFLAFHVSRGFTSVHYQVWLYRL